MASRSDPGSVLVVGGESFTGRVLVGRLRALGVETFVSSRSGEDGAIAADLLDPASLARAVEIARPDVVVNLAGYSFAGGRDYPAVYAANVVGVANLLQALEDRPPRLTIIPSSASIYAPAQDGAVVGEDHPVAPGNHYAASKAGVEHMCRVAGRALPIQVVRPFNYTGPGQDERFLTPKIVGAFARGATSITLGELDLYRDISSVDDTCEAYVRLIMKAEPTEPLNICSGRRVHLASLVEILKKISGRDMAVVRDQALIRSGEPKSITGDRRRLEASIGGWDLQTIESLLERMYRSAVSNAALT